MNGLTKLRNDALVSALRAQAGNNVVVVRGQLGHEACDRVAGQFGAVCANRVSKYGWTALELVRHG